MQSSQPTSKELTVNAMQKIQSRNWVMFVDDERDLDNGIIVMLKDGWEFVADPGCGTRGFDTVAEALRETTSKCVRLVKELTA